MSGLEPFLPLAWGVLRLMSRMILVDYITPVGTDEVSVELEWSGDVILKAHEKARLDARASSPTVSEALQAHTEKVCDRLCFAEAVCVRWSSRCKVSLALQKLHVVG